MIDGPLRCVECGAVWQSAPAARVAAAHGGCLTCGGKLVPEPDEAPPRGEPEADQRDGGRAP